MRAEIGKGVSWMVLFRVGDRILAIVSMVILARLLTPEDFGLVAMAMSVIAVIELATALGFDIPLINKANPNRVDFDTAWTLTILVYVGCAAIIAAISTPMAAFFGEPRLTPLLLVIVLGWVLRGFENVGIVEFRRQMNFAREFAFYGLRRLAGFVVTITGAILFRSYWALVAGMLASAIAGLLLSYALASYRPRLALGAARELLSHSRWLLTNNAIIVAVVRFPHFLIGRLLGASSLGVFALSYDIATMPATELSAPVNRGAFPGYSRMISDVKLFKRTFLDIGALVLTVALPAGLGLALVADELVRVFLGQKWIATIPIIRILAVSAVFVAASGNNGMAHLALGYTKFVALQSLLRLGALVVFSLMLVDQYGIAGVAIAELCGGIVIFVASCPLVFRRLGIGAWEYGARTWRPVVASMLMIGSVLAVRSLGIDTEKTSGAALTLTYSVFAGVVAYSASLMALWWLSGRPEGAERVLINKVMGAGATLRRRLA